MTHWTTGDLVTAADLNDGLGRPLATWTPTLTTADTGADPTTSSAEGSYFRIGRVVMVWARFVLSAGGGTGQDAGALLVDLPVAADTTADAMDASTELGAGSALGTFHIHDDSAGLAPVGSVQLRTSTHVHFIDSAGAPSEPVQSDDGRLSASGDVLTFTATYLVASS